VPITARFDAASTARDVVAGIDLRGRNAIVTGGGGGMGREIGAALVEAGAHVVLADVDAAPLRAAAEATGAEAVLLDLASLAAVRRFASAWDRPLHMLVNNAGVMACPELRTAEGHELQFGVNYLGHWLLATSLLAPLEAAAQAMGEPARIVSVSSIAHRRSDIHWDDIDYRGLWPVQDGLCLAGHRGDGPAAGTRRGVQRAQSRRRLHRVDAPPLG
jgi:NAD(P)-dependent dehydrogenase (short-subunit alcohol dehydrogenase family)